MFLKENQVNEINSIPAIAVAAAVVERPSRNQIIIYIDTIE